MGKWLITNKTNDLYTLTKNDDYIILQVLSDFKDKTIDILTRNMTKDGLIFTPDSSYPTDYCDVDWSIIGMVSLYEGHKYKKDSLVTVKIIESSVSNPKEIVEQILI